MKHPATLLVIAMFGSFAVILGLMIAIFQPEGPVRQPVGQVSAPHHEQPVREVPQPASVPPETTRLETPPVVAASPHVEPRRQPPPISQSAEDSRRLYRELEREKEEMAKLRADLEKRLKTALSEHENKLRQLARRCEPLEAGEAAQILIDLSDSDLKQVLRFMHPDKAAPVMALLNRLGRERAVSSLNRP